MTHSKTENNNKKIIMIIVMPCLCIIIMVTISWDDRIPNGYLDIHNPQLTRINNSLRVTRPGNNEVHIWVWPLSLGSLCILLLQHPFLSTAYLSQCFYAHDLIQHSQRSGGYDPHHCFRIMLLTKYKLHWDQYRAFFPHPIYCFKKTFQNRNHFLEGKII